MAKEQSPTSFLTESERMECGRIAQTDSGLSGQRAKAILMVDSGLTHREAGLKAGLSIGQVRYILNRYRRIGLDVFPASPPVSEKPSVNQQKSTKKTKRADGKQKKGKKKDKKKKQRKSKKEPATTKLALNKCVFILQPHLRTRDATLN